VENQRSPTKGARRNGKQSNSPGKEINKGPDETEGTLLCKKSLFLENLINKVFGFKQLQDLYYDNKYSVCIWYNFPLDIRADK